MLYYSTFSYSLPDTILFHLPYFILLTCSGDIYWYISFKIERKYWPIQIIRFLILSTLSKIWSNHFRARKPIKQLIINKSNWDWKQLYWGKDTIKEPDRLIDETFTFLNEARREYYRCKSLEKLYITYGFIWPFHQ